MESETRKSLLRKLSIIKNIKENKRHREEQKEYAMSIIKDKYLIYLSFFFFHSSLSTLHSPLKNP
ncbi:MAG: hypothetical protein WC834_07565, partial [Eubacteriales bacterium]